MNKNKLNFTRHAIYVLQKQMSQSRFWKFGFFIVISISFGVSSLFLINAINFTKTNIIMIDKQPMFIPIVVNALLISMFLAFSAMVQVAREYEQGTYELLLYGPVDENSFILGYFVAQIKIFFISLFATLLWILICSWQLNFVFSLNIIGLFLCAFFMTMELVSIGLLFASLGRNVRTAVIYFSLLIVFFGGITLGDVIVSRMIVMSSTIINDPMLVVRDVLLIVNNIIKWISPYSLMMNAMNGILNQTFEMALLNMCIMVSETFLLLFGSIFFIQKKGVRTA